MKTRRNESGKSEPPVRAGSGRLPYSPPRILYREGLEMIASTCSAATAKANVGACPLGPIQS